MTSSRLVRALTAGAVAAGANFVGSPLAIAQATDTANPPTEAQTDAGSDGQIEEIVVTAQRREEASRDVPITITTLSVDQLATANVTQLSDTAKLTPGLRFDTQGPAMQPTIRGVGTAITTSGGGPNVGIYVDGFFQPNTYVSNFQLMEVKNIQVLKGPQGTLFGRNTTGGAILVSTADPSVDTSGEIRVGYGRFNTSTVQAYGTTGLGENVALDVEGLLRRGDGFFTDAGNGDDHIGKYDDWSARTGLKVQLSDTVSVLLRYEHASVDDPTTQLVNAFVDTTGQTGFFDTVADPQASYGKSSTQGLALINLNATAGSYATAPRQVLLNQPVGFKAKSDTVQGTVKADLGEADLTSYTQYRYDHTPYHADLDATAVPLFTLLVNVKDTTFSQEFVLNSKPGSRLQWTAGANYFQYTDDWSDIQAAGLIPSFGFDPSTTDLTPFGGSSTKTKSTAAFADLSYELVPEKLFLTAGGRYSHDLVTDAYFQTNQFTPFTGYTGPDGENVPFSGPPETRIPVDKLKRNSFSPRVVLRYKPGDLSSVYASYAQGYKAGILNVGGDSQKPVAPEKNKAFELGYKYETRTWAADLAGFLYDYKDLQVSSFQNGAANITNAASARIYGLEGQVRYSLNRNLNVNAGGTWTHARYRSFAGAPFYGYCDPQASAGSPSYCASGSGSIVEVTTDASGYRMQRAPDYTATLGSSYRIPADIGEFTLSGNLYYTSSFYFDPEQQFKQDAYPLLSLRTQWVDPSRRYTVAVFGDNVTNEHYQTQVLFNTLGIGSVWSPPLTYGVSVSAKF
ncbi:MAG: TonB-dependent receptor [Hydrocarboniphaga sp.]|uniref:TonB-dependent receptor n=1 Tax=Hydrocarboniphaga sp. TaxID=2033016 RepID=UPI002616F3EC|nr:TonB-dependent receptor [Hydrocarboniphaga sp.]MDB5970391.1 TonB-dependent receptor [Hydrocarboniphaga sp.]